MRVAWITGASSGIGEALARVMAREGWRVYISARRAERLDALATEGLGDIRSLPLDVTDGAATRAAVAQIYAESGQLDQVVLNAGVFWPQKAETFKASDVHDMFAVNVGGIAEGLEAVLPPMLAAKRGKICLLGSVAGYRGLPTSPAYCGTKAAILAMGESLRPELEGTGVVLQVASPGFVRSEATAINTFPMPFLMEADAAAAAFYRGLNGHDRFEITFPKVFAVILKSMMSLPYWLFFALMRPLVPRDSVAEEETQSGGVGATVPASAARRDD